MKGFFDPQSIEKYRGFSIVLDTNILASMYASEDYLRFIFETFNDYTLFLDPIVKLEFLRGAYSNVDFEKKSEFLAFEQFAVMADHQEIFKKVYANTVDVARIYAHNGNTNIPLGDLLIIARLMLYPHMLFLTLDKGDFSTILFDRCNVISVEKIHKNKAVLEHLTILQFNQQTYEDCYSHLPKGR